MSFVLCSVYDLCIYAPTAPRRVHIPSTERKKKITNYSLLLNAPFVTTRVREAVNEVKRTLHVFVSSCAFSVYLRFFSLVFLFISFRRRLGDLTA